jgi:hypothetical protein
MWWECQGMGERLLEFGVAALQTRSGAGRCLSGQALPVHIYLVSMPPLIVVRMDLWGSSFDLNRAACRRKPILWPFSY